VRSLCCFKSLLTAGRQPIPVCLTRKDLKGELERALSSTYMNQNRGTCTYAKKKKKFTLHTGFNCFADQSKLERCLKSHLKS
jgi:hypothetical protein